VADGAPQISPAPALALPGPFRYKPGLISDFAWHDVLAVPADAADNVLSKPSARNLQGPSHGRSEKKNIAVAAWHAPFG
jgi:hypothetical protein